MVSEKTSILIVEDNDENRDILERRLIRDGYNVVSARDGREGLAVLKGDLFDLVILDIHMPIMDGIEVLRSIKNEENLSHIPVIMLTAIEEMDTVLECMRLGACGYLTKPYNMSDVRLRILDCLNRPIGV